MIDLHCHILPGIDDGPQSLEQAVEMCRLAAAAGCEALVATPHQRKSDWWNCDRAALAALRRRLQEAVGPAPRILAGGEIRVDPRLLAEMLALGEDDAHGPLPLAGSRYLLLEFGSDAGLPEAADLVHELSVAGWRPVLAHPEFIHWMARDTAVVAHLVSLGALAQVTAMSLTGDFGRRAQADACRLVEMGLVHFVASDAHDVTRRPPGLRRAWDAIAARWGEEAARELLADNPRAVMADRPLPSLAPAVPGEAAGGPGDPAKVRAALRFTPPTPGIPVIR
ncbi:MAG TPA: CpsB/CapC family capsule biosynthesis tyrosine phosphatase [Thermoanaerobaculia bacterium]|jgi:protein-tyrosine phosphatase|nr:CpsB/CapC family capsule biosynthesis tyrosine phosphatase [Thermoanaerobaculia bacterium]